MSRPNDFRGRYLHRLDRSGLHPNARNPLRMLRPATDLARWLAVSGIQATTFVGSVVVIVGTAKIIGAL